MNSDPENQTDSQMPNSLEERLLRLDAKAAKKALHDSRVLKRLGIVFYVFGVCILLLEPLLVVLPRLPGFGDMRVLIRIWTVLLFPLIVVLPAFGFALRHCRSTAAQWLFRIVAILGIVAGVLDMINMVRQANWFGFFGELVSVLISVRLVVITYNDILFGRNPPSHNQLHYLRAKWKAGQKPDHIPEHIHKPKKYARACFYVAFLMIPVALFWTVKGISEQMQYSKAQENYEAGKKAFAEAAVATSQQEMIGKYTQAYFNFKLAAADPANEDVHVFLGLCSARGLGCAKDAKEAFRQLTMHPAATNNSPDAQYELALLYLYGRGTDRNVEQAALLLKAAAQHEQREAMALLGWKEKTEDGETSYLEPDYGGLTVEQYLEKKVTDEAVRNAGKSSTEE